MMARTMVSQRCLVLVAVEWSGSSALAHLQLRRLVTVFMQATYMRQEETVQ